MKRFVFFAAVIGMMVGVLGSGTAFFADLPSQHSPENGGLADLPSQHSGENVDLADLPSQHSGENVDLADLPSQHSLDPDLV